MGMQEFVTAEDVQNPCAGVWVMLETLSVKIEDTAVPKAFVVTTSTGYRATLPACGVEHAPGFINCTRKINEKYTHAGMSVDKWLDHCRTHCHRYHLPMAEKFRDDVMDTYRA